MGSASCARATECRGSGSGTTPGPTSGGTRSSAAFRFPIFSPLSSPRPRRRESPSRTIPPGVPRRRRPRPSGRRSGGSPRRSSRRSRRDSSCAPAAPSRFRPALSSRRKGWAVLFCPVRSRTPPANTRFSARLLTGSRDIRGNANHGHKHRQCGSAVTYKRQWNAGKRNNAGD